MDSRLYNSLRGEFVWYPKRGVGYLPQITKTAYDKAYYDEYKRRGKTELGEKINTLRATLVDKYLLEDEWVLDIGCGACDFIKKRGHAYGYDICANSQAWLLDNNLFMDPYSDEMLDVKALTFFDSFEHIPDVSVILSRFQGEFIVMSIPIFNGLSHIFNSKHYKPEHIYYFTEYGLQEFLGHMGYDLLQSSWAESALGREDIGTFVFARKA